MQMVDLAGRQHVVKLFINLVRWLRTVHVLSLLPPTPPAQLLEPFKRPSPYPGKVSILLHFLISIHLTVGTCHADIAYADNQDISASR